MLKFKRVLSWIELAIIVTPLATACSLLHQQNTPVPTAQFDDNPLGVIIYAYIHYPGIPIPTKTPQDRYCADLPSLIVWGDGLVFLDEKILNDYTSVLSGRIAPSVIQTLLDILTSENFFTNWQPPGPNPGGTSMRIGAQLMGKPVTEYFSGDLGPHIYVQLVEMVRPEVEPLTDQTVVDQRILAVLKSNENCNKYMYSR